MRSAGAVIGTAIFLVFVPCVLAGVVPWWISRWEFLPPFFDVQATRAVGMLLIVAGLPGLVDSFARFALQGLGTPAPIAPPLACAGVHFINLKTGEVLRSERA